MRPSGAPGRSRSPLSELGETGDRGRAKQGVVIRLSADAQRILGRREGADAERGPTRRGEDDRDGELTLGSTGGDKAGGRDQAPVAGQARKLTPEDKRVVTRLAARDTEVRAHESAHQAAASGLGGAASFSYETGPDGRSYAVGGEVPVSLRPGRTPEETIANAQTVRSAALAPADPSAQDLAVAAQATQMEAEARQQQVRERAEGTRPGQTGERAGAVGARGDSRAEPGNPAVTKPGGDAKPDGVEKPPARDVEQDQVMIFSALKAERGGVDGGHRHLASGGSCGICSRAAARYA